MFLHLNMPESWSKQGSSSIPGQHALRDLLHLQTDRLRLPRARFDANARFPYRVEYAWSGQLLNRWDMILFWQHGHGENIST